MPEKPRKPRGDAPLSWVPLFSDGIQTAMPWAYEDGLQEPLPNLTEPEAPRILPTD